MEHIELITLASIAFFASIGHCIGMCGGIVLAYSASLPAHNPFTPQNSNTLTPMLKTQKGNTHSIFYHIISSLVHQLPFHLLYHCGKITTYCVLGFLVGTLGHIAMPNENIKFSILLVIGILLVIYGLAIGQFVNLHIRSLKFPFYAHIITFMRSLLTQGTKWRLYILGLCNGLLPCGIVYYFLLTATIAGNGVNGAIVMGIFGLMTIPSLLLLGLVSSSLQNKRLLFLRLSGATMVGFGLYEMYKASKSLGLLPLF